MHIYHILSDNFPSITQNYFSLRHSISLAILSPGDRGSPTDRTSPSAHDLISQTQPERLVLRGPTVADLLLAEDHRQRCPALRRPLLLSSSRLKAIWSLQSQSQQTSSHTIREEFMLILITPIQNACKFLLLLRDVWFMCNITHHSSLLNTSILLNTI